jgi:hypothetical protein
MTASMPTFLPQPQPQPRRSRRSAHSLYLDLLGAAFALFNAARVLSYLPTLWAIHASGDSSQHSLWTWACWFGANLTMAAWVYEHNGKRCDRVVLLSLVNAIMCFAAIVLIVAYRIGGAA